MWLRSIRVCTIASGQDPPRVREIGAGVIENGRNSRKSACELVGLAVAESGLRNRDGAIHFRSEAEIGPAVERQVLLPRPDRAVLKVKAVQFRERQQVIDQRESSILSRHRRYASSSLYCACRGRIDRNSVHDRCRHEGAGFLEQPHQRRIVPCTVGVSRRRSARAIKRTVASVLTLVNGADSDTWRINVYDDDAVCCSCK